jgi:hypothetical protein
MELSIGFSPTKNYKSKTQIHLCPIRVHPINSYAKSKSDENGKKIGLDDGDAKINWKK